MSDPNTCTTYNIKTAHDVTTHQHKTSNGNRPRVTLGDEGKPASYQVSQPPGERRVGPQLSGGGQTLPATGWTEAPPPAAGEDRTPAAGEDKCLTRHHPRKRPTAVVEKRGESGGHVHEGKRRVSTAP